MKTIRGPGLFLAQFVGDRAPFDTLESLARWAAGLGYAGIQVPTTAGLLDLTRAAESRTYCDELRGKLAEIGVQITELSTHIQGQLVAVHPAYDALFDGFAPEAVRGNPAARTDWAIAQLKLAARASANLGLSAHASFSGALAWPFVYPWPQRPAGLIDEAFAELGRRWRPILDAFDAVGVDVAYELHPGEDLHDGITFERFLDAVGGHKRANILYDPSHFVLQALDYLAFIDIYHERIKAFHVKDAELNPTGRSGVYGGYQGWADRPGRCRSLGDGSVKFGAVFSKMAQYDFPGWAVLEWECALKHPEDGAREGALFIRDHIIRVTEHAFDDFARSGVGCGGKSSVAWIVREDGMMTNATRIRLGMIGGGTGAFIGEVHRIAARMDNRFELVAGVFNADPARGSASAAAIGIDPDRAYDSYEAMFAAEVLRDDGAEVIAIVTPNHLHFPAAMAALDAGFHVICEKPMTATLDEAETAGRARHKRPETFSS